MFALTPRLLLRPGWSDDAHALARTIGDQAVLRNLARAPSPYGLADAQHFLAQGFDDRAPNFLITRRANAELIGGIAIERDALGGGELGYWIARGYWGQGYASEAARAVVALARHSLRLSRLTAAHFVDNPASGRVLAKLGFAATGRHEPRMSVARGRADRCELYALALDDAQDAPMRGATPLPIAA